LEGAEPALSLSKGLSAPHEDEKTAATVCRPPEEMSPKPFNFSGINFESPTSSIMRGAVSDVAWMDLSAVNDLLPYFWHNESSGC